MSFVQPMIDNTNNDVRDLAYKIVAQICIHEGESYASEYTNSMRDAQKEILSKKIASLGGTKRSGKGSVKSAKPTAKQALTSKDIPQKSKSKEKHESRPSSQKEDSISKKILKNDDDKTTKASKTKKASFSEDAIETKSDKDTKKTSRKSKSDSSQEQCLFCEKDVEITAEDSLERHYAGECPYLTECPQCGLIVEIILLQTHMYGNCEQAPSDPKSVIINLINISAIAAICCYHLWTICHIVLKRNVKYGTLIMILPYADCVKNQSWENPVGKYICCPIRSAFQNGIRKRKSK